MAEKGSRLGHESVVLVWVNDMSPTATSMIQSPSVMTTRLILAIALLAPAGAQDLLAPKSPPAKYVAPHKPHTKLADLKTRHSGHDEWREVIADDEHLRAEYIQSKPGAKHPRALHPDTRAWWVIMDGQIRFDIEGTDSFVASKGSIVQVPMQTLFSFEITGDKPALRFEVNIAGAKTLYARDATPPKMPGFDWLPVRFPRTPG